MESYIYNFFHISSVVTPPPQIKIPLHFTIYIWTIIFLGYLHLIKPGFFLPEMQQQNISYLHLLIAYSYVKYIKKNQDISLEIQVWDRYRDVAGLKTWLKIIFLCSEMFFNESQNLRYE